MEKNFITVRNCHAIKRIEVQLILYMQIDCDCLTFHLENTKQFSCSKSLSGIIDELPAYFIQKHRDCIVNLHKISEYKVKNRSVVLLDGTVLNVSFRNVKKLTFRRS